MYQGHLLPPYVCFDRGSDTDFTFFFSYRIEIFGKIGRRRQQLLLRYLAARKITQLE